MPIYNNRGGQMNMFGSLLVVGLVLPVFIFWGDFIRMGEFYMFWLVGNIGAIRDAIF
jgi:hypothetical protein